jgi:hypothetical protein
MPHALDVNRHISGNPYNNKMNMPRSSIDPRKACHSLGLNRATTNFGTLIRFAMEWAPQ